MYGYTPPAVLAVDPAFLSDCGGFQRIAWALHEQLLRRPVWVVVCGSVDLEEESPEEQAALLESYFMDPAAVPARMPESTDESVALALQSHLRDHGIELPILLSPVRAQPHAVRSAIVPGPWGVAAGIARTLGASRVTAWTQDTRWVPRSVEGMPFDSSTPGGPRLDGLPIGG